MEKILKFIWIGIFSIGIILAFWAFIIEPSRLVIRTYDLKVKNWSPKLKDFKIVAISDIHGGSNFVTEERIREVVAKANEQNPDMIVLLGDFVSQQHLDRSKLKMPMETVAENLRGLNAKYGVYAVMGNHDKWYDLNIVRQELEKVNYKVLDKEAVSIEKDGEKLRLFGISVSEDKRGPYVGQAAKDTLAALKEKDGRIIILAHYPDDVVNLTAGDPLSEDFVLYLAGHTHGGQCQFPLIGAPIVPSEYGEKYVQGFIRDRGIDIFVTPGIGMSILPVRFGVPPEISVLNINAE